MKLRKLFALLMAAVMLLGMMPMANAELTGCNHDWDSGKWLRGTPSNCQDWKPKTYTCTICGATATNEECGPCVPGSKTWIRPQGSNCMEFGVWEITCKYCGEWLEGGEEPGPHHWVTRTVEEPTCTESGWMETICSYCESEQNGPVSIPALGHDWSDWLWDNGEPSCNSGAWQYQVCSRCRLRNDRWVEGGSHRWGDWKQVSSGTCIKPGHEERTCSICGAKEGRDGTTGNHSWGQWKLIDGGTCLTPGKEQRTCSLCGKTEERTVSGSGHNMGSWYRSGVPTCTREGMMRRDCSRCDYYELDPIPKIDHQFGEWYTVILAAVNVPGLEERKCSMCGLTEEREIPALPPEYGNLEGGNDFINGITPIGKPECILSLDSIPANGEYFVVGEEVVFTASWVNNSGATLFPFYVSIWPYEQPSRDSKDLPYCCSYDAEEPITPGMTGSHSLVTTVTEEDVARGGIYAMAYIWSSVHNGPEVEEVATPFVTAPCAPVAGSDYATSIKLEVFDIPSVTAEWAGDVYTAKVKVTNTGDTTVTLYSSLFTDSNGQYYPNAVRSEWNKYETDPDWSWVRAGESLTTDIEFVVTQKSIKAGELRFNFTQFANPWYVEAGNAETNIPADIVAEPEGTTGYYGKRDEEASDTVEIVVPINQGATEFDPEGLTVTKTASAGDYSNPCKPGDEVTFTITVTNNTGVELLDVEITDPIKGGNEDAIVDIIPSMQPGESVTASFSYIVTEEDATVGVEGFENTAYASGYTADGTQVSGTSETIFVWCVIEHGLTFFKSIANVPANGVFFVPGETIVFDISMFNHTPYPLYNIMLTDPLCQDQYIYDAVNDMSYLYFGELYPEGNAMGESTSATVTVSYVVTEADAEAGSVTNTAEVTYQTWYGKEMSDSASATAPCGPGEPMNSAGIRLEKALRNAPANGEYYVPGEVLNYALTLRLDDGLLLDDAAIYDPIAGGDGLVISYGKGLYGGMGNDVFYTVTEEDAQRGYVENTAYATWLYSDSGEAGRCESETVIAVCGMGELPDDYQDPGSVKLTLTEWSSPANGTHYVPGEEINVHHRLFNNSRDITMTVGHEHFFQINGDGIKEIDAWPGYIVLLPGTSHWVYSWSPTVTEADAARGYVERTTTFYLMGDDGNEYTATGSIRLPCGPGGDAVSAPVVVTKAVANTPANGEYFVVGETIEFSITVTNNSGNELTGMIITDPLNADWICEINEPLLPGESRTEIFSYVVTWLDAAAGSVENYASVRIIGADGYRFLTSNVVTAPCWYYNIGFLDDVPEYPIFTGTVVVPPFGVITGLEVTKEVESLPLNGSYYTEGETVAYRITYTNSGETPLTDVMIYDSLAGMTEIATAENLAVGESRWCTFNHTVTAEDVTRGYVSNTAIGQFEIEGYLNTVHSNTVVVDTDGQPDPEIPEDILPPGGVIDISKLNSDQYCRRVTSSRTNVSYSWGTSFCSDHAAIQGNNLMMEQAASTPAMQMQAAAYAVALWRAEVDKLYEELLGAADPQARAVIMAEYVSFLTHASNYETLLKALYPDQPALVAQKMSGLWEEKCITLCQEMHMPAAARQDSFLAVDVATMEGISDACACVTCDEGKGWNSIEQNYCPTHSFPFVMIDTLLGGQDTAEAWTTVRQIWNVELHSGYNKVIALLSENSDVALAEYATLESWMIARETELMLFYPENPELVAQTMVRIVIDQVNALCQMAK